MKIILHQKKKLLLTKKMYLICVLPGMIYRSIQTLSLRILRCSLLRLRYSADVYVFYVKLIVLIYITLGKYAENGVQFVKVNFVNSLFIINSVFLRFS